MHYRICAFDHSCADQPSRAWRSVLPGESVAVSIMDADDRCGHGDNAATGDCYDVTALTPLPVLVTVSTFWVGGGLGGEGGAETHELTGPPQVSIFASTGWDDGNFTIGDTKNNTVHGTDSEPVVHQYAVEAIETGEMFLAPYYGNSGYVRQKRASGRVGGGASEASATKGCPSAVEAGRIEDQAAEAGEWEGWRGHERSERNEGVSCCGRSGQDRGPSCSCSSVAEAGRIEDQAAAALLRQKRAGSRTKLQLLFCGGSGQNRGPSCSCSSAAEAGRISGCRGETPRTPPTAGEVAHELGMFSAAHVLGRTCARPHMCSAAHVLGRAPMPPP
jgi:hypothetical protein